MWGRDRSVLLSSILIKAVYVIIAVCCAAAPWIVRYYDEAVILKNNMPSVYAPLLITLYCAVPPAIAALISLDVLLNNIKKNRPFITANVKLLRIISYCCFAEGLVFVYFGTIRVFAFIIVIVCAFFGLILRVVKNVFEQAVALREENDFTI